MADTLWKFAAALSKVGLAAALIGLIVVAYYFIRNLENDPPAKEPITDAPWITRGAKIGFILLFSGIALSCFVIILRIVYPWGE
jgi:hypothetical protein